MSQNLLIIFTKNLIPGKVKTRLAASTSDEFALEIYERLLEHTIKITNEIPFDKAVFYSDYIEKDDLFSLTEYSKFIQAGEDLGERMKSAFAYAFERGYRRVVVIGTDCPQITRSHLVDAFEDLRDADVVIGPASDGGYYLIGMRKQFPLFFENKEWGSENVFLDTLNDIKANGISFRLLETLSDIDTLEDLKSTGFEL